MNITLRIHTLDAQNKKDLHIYQEDKKYHFEIRQVDGYVRLSAKV